MARTFNGAVDLFRTTSPLAALPMTVSLWGKTTAAGQYAFSLADTGTTTSAVRFVLGVGSSRSYLEVGNTAGATDQQIAGTLVSGVWTHACGIITSNTNRAFFLDATKSAASSATVAPTSLDTVIIGGWFADSAARAATFVGDLADVAVWNVALTDPEVVALSRGASPLLVRPSALVAFWPLQANGTYLNNFVKNATSLVLTQEGGTPAAADHSPTQPLWWPSSAQSARAGEGAVSLTVASPALGAPALTLNGIFVGSQGTYLSYAQRNSSTLVAPSSIADGDLLIAFLFTGYSTTPIDATPPAGWNTLTGSPIPVTFTGFSAKFHVFWKIASSEAGNYTFTYSLNDFYTCGLVIRYTGVDPTTPFSPTPTTNTGTGVTATATGFTTTVDNTFVIFTEVDWGDNTTNTTPPTNFTERADDVLLYVADRMFGIAGATGNISHGCNSTGVNPWGSYLIGLKPAPTGGAGSHTLTASALAVTAPAVGASAIAQGHALAASALTVSALAIGASAAKQGHVLLASAASAGTPALDAPAINQKAALAASSLAVASPVIASGFVSQAGVLAAVPLATGVPIIDAPAFNQSAALTATGLAAGQPVFTAPAIAKVLAATNFAASAPVVPAATVVQVVALSPAGMTVSAPALGTPALAAIGVLAAVSLTTSSPTLDAASLVQKHVLAATSLAVTAPTVPAGTTVQSYALAATGAAAGAPVVGVATITKQGHAFATSGLATAAPAVGTGALKQKHVIAIAGMVAASPVVGVASFVQGGTCIAEPFVVLPPVIATALFKQSHLLGAPRHTAKPAVIGAPRAVIAAPPLFAVNLTVAPPSISPLPPALGFVNLLAVVPDFHTGKIEFTYPDAELIAPPELYFHVRSKHWSTDPDAEFYDDDGTQFGRPVKQAIFANLNDDLDLIVSSGTLAGRTSRERGPAEDIVVGAPLWLADKKLRIDWSDIDQLREDLDMLFEAVSINADVIAVHAAALGANAEAFLAHAAAIGANTAALATNSALLAGLKADLDKLQRQLRVYIPRDLVAGAPAIGVPWAAIRLSAAANVAVSSPAFGSPTLVRIV